MISSKFNTLLITMILVIITSSLIMFPNESFSASIRGLDIWWRVVFPSLLPFFIISEILIGYGIVRFIGVIFEPFMRPLFRVPGVGGFVLAMGLASGFPSGAKLTARLRKENQLTKLEAERLVSFTNASNPLFIFGAISVGFFHNQQLGIILALSHYVGNILVGLTIRFYGNDKVNKRIKTTKKNKSLLKSAFIALHETRMSEKRPFGKILGDAVTSSVQTLLMIGGFIIFFSVVNKLFSLLHITEMLANLISYLFTLLQISTDLSVPFIAGLFEMTIGSQLTSELSDVALLQKIATVSFLLAFSGLSIHAQVGSILAETDISYKPFFFARLLHGLYAVLLTIILSFRFNIHSSSTTEIIPVNNFPMISSTSYEYWFFLFIKIGPIFTIIVLFVYTLLLALKRNIKNPPN